MKHSIQLVFGAMLLATTVSAQDKIKDGTVSSGNTPAPGALLDLESANRALLLPRVSLSATTTWGLNGTASPTGGYTVYNTDAAITGTAAYPIITGGIGVYYWDGTGWVATKNQPSTTSYVEPWYNQANNQMATTNTQNIYQMGTVAVGRNSTYGTSALHVEGAVRGGADPKGTVGNNSVGFGNQITASGLNSAAFGNNTQASGGSSVAFGNNTEASGDHSLAMGSGTKAVGAQSGAFGYNSNASGNQSIALGNGVTASGNQSVAMGVNSYAGGQASFAMGAAAVVNDGHAYSLALGSSVSTSAMEQFVARFRNGYKFYTGLPSSSIGAELKQNTNAWSTMSSKSLKENFVPVDGKAILDKIARFELTSWNYIGQDKTSLRHYGPMAEDFYEAFGKDEIGTIGVDDSINQADFDGINMIAIQALAKENIELKARIEKLEKLILKKK